MTQKVFKSNLYDVLSQILIELKADSVLLVTGKKSFNQSTAFNQIEKLSKKYKFYRVFDFDVNPNFEDVEREVYKLKSRKFDVLISVGGGSVIDFAKLIKFYYSVSINTSMDEINNQNLSNKLPHIAIPTTAGSGSEATHFAVLYKNNVKYSISNKYLLPNYVVLDDILTLTMSSYLTACSGMDAICQAMESIWSNNADNLSVEYSKIALSYLVPHIENAVAHPNNSTRKQMLEGAHFAGKAINISKTTAAHAFSYYLTKIHNVPHGEAVGINIDFFLVENWECIKIDVRKVLLNIFNCDNKYEIANKLIVLKEKIGLKISLKQVNNLDIERYLNSINMERMQNNPKDFKQFELKEKLINYHNL